MMRFADELAALDEFRFPKAQDIRPAELKMAMQLIDRGQLSLDGPIAEVLPELAAPQVLEGFDASDEPKLRPATRPITSPSVWCLRRGAASGSSIW